MPAKMITLAILDPPICRATGVWGPDLPIILREDRVAARGRHPARRALAGFAGLTLQADSA